MKEIWNKQIDISRENTTFFTSEEVAGERLVYGHDDSESRRDTFHFLASNDQMSFQYLAVFHVYMMLRNDQTPTRVVDKVFQVGTTIA